MGLGGGGGDGEDASRFVGRVVVVVGKGRYCDGRV